MSTVVEALPVSHHLMVLQKTVKTAASHIFCRLRIVLVCVVSFLFFVSVAWWLLPFLYLAGYIWNHFLWQLLRSCLAYPNLLSSTNWGKVTWNFLCCRWSFSSGEHKSPECSYRTESSSTPCSESVVSSAIWISSELCCLPYDVVTGSLDSSSVSSSASSQERVTPMSGLDAIWLQDDPRNRCYIVVLCSLKGRVPVQSLKERLEQQFLPKHEKFRSMVAWLTGKWCWVEKPNVFFEGNTKPRQSMDARDHIFVVNKDLLDDTMHDYSKAETTGAPSAPAQLENIISEVASSELPLHLPLWRLYVVYDGQCNDSNSSSETHLVFHFHHCIGDGTSISHAFLHDFCDRPQPVSSSPSSPTVPVQRTLPCVSSTRPGLLPVHRMWILIRKQVVSLVVAIRQSMYCMYLLLFGYASMFPVVLRIFFLSTLQSTFGLCYAGPETRPRLSGKKRVALPLSVSLDWLQSLRHKISQLSTHDNIQFGKLHRSRKLLGKLGRNTDWVSTVTINDLLIYSLFGGYRRSITSDCLLSNSDTMDDISTSSFTDIRQSDSLHYTATNCNGDSVCCPPAISCNSDNQERDSASHFFKSPELRIIMPVDVRTSFSGSVGNVHAPIVICLRATDLRVRVLPTKSSSALPKTYSWRARTELLNNPLSRLKVVKDELDGLKRRNEFLAAKHLISITTSLVPPWLCKAALDVFVNQCTCLYSNVKGPANSLHVGGHEVRDIVFWPPCRAKIGWGFAVFTYGRTLNISAIADEGVLQTLLDKPVDSKLGDSMVKASDVDGMLRRLLCSMVDELTDLDAYVSSRN
eukprot:GHVQ01023578.1.p1 GENE.GHVQ01023578.1~~GHVQ01023578.1.p1  ORF type:complete len:805 (+),score=74.75 GHVQ01023578.1:302-2716(+)